jgi:hypothetical protein
LIKKTIVDSFPVLLLIAASVGYLLFKDGPPLFSVAVMMLGGTLAITYIACLFIEMVFCVRIWNPRARSLASKSSDLKK